MLVTCICVCHDKPEFAKEAIQSLVDQSYPQWEALVVDSGILYDAGYYDQFRWRHDPRIHLIRSTETPELRRSKAMAPWCINQCFRKEMVRGDLVTYLCDDDVYYPNAFETFVAYAKQNPDILAMYASQDIGVIWPNGKRTITGERRATQIGGRCANGRRMDCEVDYLQFCHRRDVLTLLGHDEYWPESKETASHADGIFMERIGEHVPIYPIDIKVSQNRRTIRSLYDPVDPDAFGNGQDSETYHSLRREMARWRAEAESWRQQFILNRSFVQSLAHSLPWRLLKPLRTMRQLFRPRGFDARALVPWRQIERDEQTGAWLATGSQPCFLVPCQLPPGRHRLRLSMSSDTPGRFEIIASAGNGISDVEVIFQSEFIGVLDLDCIIHLSQPALGLQINPLGAAGRFEIKQLEIAPLGWGSKSIRANSTQRQQVSTSTQRQQVPSPTEWIEYPNLHLPKETHADWSIVIPTVGATQLLHNCITTCREYLEPGLTAEFIVVDDGTRDPEVVQVLEHFSSKLGFQLLKNYQNLGFSASVNQGLRNAKGRFVLLCNNDIVFRQPFLGELAAAFEAQPEVGIVGCKLIYPNGTVQHAGIDKIPGQLRWSHTYHNCPSDHSAVLRGRFVWSVTGALCAIRRETLQSLGGLSTAYGFAYEDLDYCLHAWSHGVRVYFCPEAVAVHNESGTLGKTHSQRKQRPLMWAERERAGRQYFEKKWHSLRDIENFEELSRLRLDNSAPTTHQAKITTTLPSSTNIS
jgi:GT2 family glycosyltransferase